jgi:CRISPR/Cas system-associated exonuclease Cas4 (RecB family)
MPLKPVPRLSPSRYNTFQLCALREIWSSTYRPLLPLAPAARVGMVTHKLIELAGKGKIRDEAAISDCWKAGIRKQEQEMTNNWIEKHLVPLSTSTNNYKVKQLMAFDTARSMLHDTFYQFKKTKKLEAELWVQTEDGKIGGRIDLVRHTNDGIEIVDYKTGVISDQLSTEDSIKSEYQEQLQLYAALYYSTYKIWPVKLAIAGLDRREFSIPFDKEECLQLLNNAKSQLHDLNELILAGLNSEDFATPSPETCKYCAYRPACKMYWSRRQDSREWPADFAGSIKEKKILGNGMLRLVLENEERIISVRGLSPERHLLLHGNAQKVLFCNLGYDTSEGFFVETPMTTGYELNNES